MAIKIIALLASASLATTGVYAVSATRAADVLPDGPTAFMAEGNDQGQSCRVDVVRTGPSGAANVTRSVLTDGQCVCTITTGPQDNNGPAETIVNELLRDRTCNGAPPLGNIPPDQAAGSAGGMSGGVLGGLLGALVVGGLAAGLGGKSKG